jgi:hypothetical protein
MLDRNGLPWWTNKLRRQDAVIEDMAEVVAWVCELTPEGFDSAGQAMLIKARAALAKARGETDEGER